MSLMYLSASTLAGAAVDGLIYGASFMQGAISGLFMGGVTWVLKTAGIGSILSLVGLRSSSMITDFISDALVASVVDVYLFKGRFSPTNGFLNTFIYYFFVAGAAYFFRWGVFDANGGMGILRSGGSGIGIGSDMPNQVA